MPLPVHEEKLIKAFFLKERQEPYLLGLANPGKRRKITNEFCHFKHLDLRFNVPILPSQQNPAAIYDLLKKFGAPDVCWVVSDELELDTHNMSLKEALDQIVGRTFATFLCCIEGKLAYFENEDGRWIGRRP
ncbi:MAG TPA: hypothetical protein VFB76_16945 [Candidatus Angelobacter sp.]|nr:hypothetical protein [Candidatus Angelobacter sp.]